jgi:hypothetical protein
VFLVFLKLLLKLFLSKRKNWKIKIEKEKLMAIRNFEKEKILYIL